MSILNRPYFQNEEAAHTFLEGIVWPDGTVCPHCGVVGGAYKIAANPEKRVRYGLWKCRECRKQFTVKVGTVFEHARLPLHKALQAAFLICSSKKGISANQLHRTLEISLKAAWFLAHRIREAMAPHSSGTSKLGGLGKIVEIDESYVGGKESNKHADKRLPPHLRHKEIVLSLVERGGRVASHHIPSVSGKNLYEAIGKSLAPDTDVMTDASPAYPPIAWNFKSHGAVNHSAGEYVRGSIYTNTIESYFAIMKRGINGVYHHVSPQHLKRYLAEFDFRYNERAALEVDDFTRTLKALAGIQHKRLTYKGADR